MSSLDKISAGQPPSGVVPNLIDPENRTLITITIIAVIKTFAFFFVGVRLYSRLTKSGVFFSWDDAACLLAMAGSIAFSVITVDACHKAVGRHQWDIRLSTLANGDGLLQEILFLQSAYAPIIFMVKLSIFLLYLRMFALSRRVRGFIYFGIAATGVFYTFATLFPIIICSPRKGETRFVSQFSARCARDNTLGAIMTVFNVVSDHYVLAIPMPVVWKLQLPTRKKIEISAVFLIGVLGCVCGVVNSYYRIMLAKTKDPMWHLVPVLITSIVEIDIGIIVSCTPNLKSVMHTHLAQVAQLFSFSYLRSRLSFLRSQRTRISSEPRTSSNEFHNVDHINTRSGGDKDILIEVRSLKNV